MKTFTLSLLLLIAFNATVCIAQKKEKYILPKGSWLFRFNPTGMIDPVETNFSVGGEYRFHSNWSVSADAAWIFYSSYFGAKHTNGFIFRPAIRYYIPHTDGMFVETELHYKYVSYRIEDWLGKNCVNGVPSYEEFTRFSYLKQAWGFHIKTGYQERIGRDKRFWMEAYLGIGPRWRSFKVKDEPNSCYTHAGDASLNIINNNLSVAIPMGIRLMYTFKK